MHLHFILASILLVTAASGAETIDSIVANALANNPEIALLDRQVLHLREAKAGAAAAPPRELALSAGFKSAADDEGLAWAASISHTFDWSGRPALRRALAEQDVALAELGVATFKAEIAATLRGLAAQVMANTERAQLADTLSERFASLSGVFTQRDPSGLPPLLETRVMEAAALVNRQAAAEARIETRQAEAELNLILGRPVTQEVSLARTALAFSPAQAWDDFRAAAEKGNFQLQALAAELRRQGLEVDLAALAQKATWTLQPFIEEERVEGTERTVGVGLTRPLNNPSASASEKASARARQAQAEAMLLAARRDWLTQLGRAYVSYASHQGQLDAGWEKELAQVREAMDTADRHFRLGAVNAATLSELQERHGEAIASLQELKIKAAEAGLELERLTGGTVRLVEWKEIKP